MRFDLASDKIPTAWYNALPRLPEPLQPPLHPATREPVGPDDLAPLFPMALIQQEMSAEPWIDIPGEVIDILRLWRPTPLVRAERLEQELGTPARIYFKDESISPAGSHKPNTAVAQAFYNKAEGIKRIATETGAGQWGSSMAFAAATSFATPVGYPTNTMVYYAGGYRFTDFMKVGIPLIAMFCALSMWLIPKFWPFHP